MPGIIKKKYDMELQRNLKFLGEIRNVKRTIYHIPDCLISFSYFL